MRVHSLGLLATAALAACAGAAAQPIAGAGEESAAAATARALASACSEKRYSDAAEYLHSSLRRSWIDIDYKVKDYCEALTRGSTLRSVAIDKEEQVEGYVILFLVYTFTDGQHTEDRAAYLQEKGAWKLTDY